MTSHDDTYGPGTRWLADRVGASPEELLRDPVRLLRELAQATAELAAATASPDPDVRRAAAEQADQLEAQFTAGAPPSRRLGTMIARALRHQAESARRTHQKGSDHRG